MVVRQMHPASDSSFGGTTSEMEEAIMQPRWLALFRNARSRTRGGELIVCMRVPACMHASVAEIMERNGHGDRDARRKCTTS